MRGLAGHLADLAARQLLSWLQDRVEPGSREWLDALMAESDCASGGWQRLRWALGGVPLVWTINRRRRLNDPRHGSLRARIVAAIANVAAIAGWYAVIIPATYAAAGFFRCHLALGDSPGGCQEHPVIFGTIAIGGAVLGMVSALWLRARFAAYWWAVFSAVNVVGCVWYLRSGIVDLPRYGPTQSPMLVAATFGAVLVAMMRASSTVAIEREPLHHTGGTSAAPGSFVSRHRMVSHLIAGTIGFAVADSLYRMGDRPMVADNVNHYAVLGSAMFATFLAGLVGRHGGRRPVEATLVRL
jgi:hypothetical protein